MPGVVGHAVDGHAVARQYPRRIQPGYGIELDNYCGGIIQRVSLVEKDWRINIHYGNNKLIIPSEIEKSHLIDLDSKVYRYHILLMKY